MEESDYRKIVGIIQDTTGKNTGEIELLKKKYEEKFGRLYKRNKEGRLMKVLKKDEIDSVLWMMHNHPTGGHFGIENTYGKIKERFYWKGMKRDIEQYIKYCDACQRRGKKGGKGYLNPIKVERPFKRIGIDFVGPLPRTRKGNRYIIVAMDYLTKWPEAKAMKEATAENVVQFIYKRIICQHGCPKIILSDRGTHFRNKLVDGLCEKFEIKHKLSSPYHPQTNGLVERFNRTLCESLAKVSKKENEWDIHIGSVLFAYRTTKHSTTKMTPFFMVYGREAILPIDDIKEGENLGKEAIIERTYDLINLTDKRIEALGNIERSQIKQKGQHDMKIKEETKLEIGDKVLLKDAAKEKQWTGKLSSKWKGPYYIHEIIGKGAYKLRTIEGKVLKTSRNIKHLKKYFSQQDSTPLVFV